MTEQRKRGPISHEEKQFLKENFHLYTDEELAKKINRTTKWVSKYRAKYQRPVYMYDEDMIAIEDELKGEYFWEEIKEQFTEIEQMRFSDRWVQLSNQFGDSVVATDKMQMVDLIRYELLLARILKQEKRMMEELEEVNMKISNLNALGPDDDDYNEVDIMNLRKLQIDLVAGSGARGRDIKQLQDDKNKLFSQLKSTRDQRIKQFEETKTTFWDLIRSLDNHDIRERDGRHAELLKMATDKCFDDMSKNIQYEDGTVDRPLYNSETSKLDDLEIGESRPEDDENKDWINDYSEEEQGDTE